MKIKEYIEIKYGEKLQLSAKTKLKSSHSSNSYDKILNLFEDKKVITIGGDTGDVGDIFGKNCLCEYNKRFVMQTGRYPKIVYLSMERRGENVFNEFLSIKSGVALGSIKQNITSDFDNRKLRYWCNRIKEWDIEFYDMSTFIDMHEVKEWLTGINRIKHIDLLFIALDYWNYTGNQIREAKVLFNLLKERLGLDCPIMLLCPIRVGISNHEDDLACPKDLAIDGLDKVSDVVITLYDPGYWDDTPPEVELDVPPELRFNSDDSVVARVFSDKSDNFFDVEFAAEKSVRRLTNIEEDDMI